ncbi:hypothetical protein D4764_13G0008440 [Takifugu flavidus]|uniref:Uncharacterized protein n=1 Tax=Takifugu flavidus TaxID=433684 RepID=A0A5C6P8Y8_9TELE|nr:hypothetical protein D4764_13G0008440 [Takifugu flavidus]
MGGQCVAASDARGVPRPRSPPPPDADVVGWSGAAALKVASASEALRRRTGAELRANLTEKSPSVSAELVPWFPRDHPRLGAPTAAAGTGGGLISGAAGSGGADGASHRNAAMGRHRKSHRQQGGLGSLERCRLTLTPLTTKPCTRRSDKRPQGHFVGTVETAGLWGVHGEGDRTPVLHHQTVQQLETHSWVSRTW